MTSVLDCVFGTCQESSGIGFFVGLENEIALNGDLIFGLDDFGRRKRDDVSVPCAIDDGLEIVLLQNGVRYVPNTVLLPESIAWV